MESLFGGQGQNLIDYLFEVIEYLKEFLSGGQSVSHHFLTKFHLNFEGIPLWWPSSESHQVLRILEPRGIPLWWPRPKSQQFLMLSRLVSHLIISLLEFI